MDEQRDKGNQYTYNGITDRQGQSIYIRWMKRDKGNQYTYDGRRKTREINIPTMDEDKQGQSNIPTINEQTDKGNQYTYDG